MPIVLRLDKGLPLTFSELDGNFTDLVGRSLTLDERVDILEGKVFDLETDVDLLGDNFIALSNTVSNLNASQIDYVNTGTGLAGDDVQEALDQIWALTQNRVTTNTAQAITAPKRATPITDNDGSFDFASGQNFVCTPTGAVTLTFTVSTGLIAGQSGFIKLNNPSGFAITANTAYDFDTTFLATLSTPGSYLIAYFAESNTKVNLVASAALV